jgi:ribonuclease-3
LTGTAADRESRSEPSQGTDGAVEAVVAAVGHAFNDRQWVETALSHSSFAHEQDGSRGNERLEFLGDAVLGLAVADLLFAAYPDWDEGELTRTRAGLVNQRALATRARALGLNQWVKLGRTEQHSGGSEKDSILANCFEAVIGAIFLDGGLAPATEFIRREFAEGLKRGAVRDAKTAFQEWAHARFSKTPVYRTVDDSGTDNDEQRFTVEVSLDEQTWGRGVGRTKRAAEREAAVAALDRRPEFEASDNG